jgi:predicted transcriptional regulator YheO
MEQWKAISGYPNYLISNTGKVYTKNRGKLLSPKVDRYGYYAVGLCKNNKVKHFTIHRLVATAFLPLVDNCNVVNHKDGNKQNNNADNLEWTTVSGNTKHCFNTNKEFKTQVLNNAKRGAETKSKSIAVYLAGVFVGRYNSIIETANSLKINRKTVYNALHSKYSNRKGYKFTLC